MRWSAALLGQVSMMFTPEIGSAARDVKVRKAYDDVKVDAVLNEIGGKRSRWKGRRGRAGAFRMASRKFRFAQVIPTGGYTDASGTPSGAAA